MSSGHRRALGQGLRRTRSPAAQRFAAARAPGARTRWRRAEWLAIDLELTALRPDGEIIAIGAVPISDGALIRFGRTLLVYREGLSGMPEPAHSIGGLVGPYGLRGVATAVEAGSPTTLVPSNPGG